MTLENPGHGLGNAQTCGGVEIIYVMKPMHSYSCKAKIDKTDFISTTKNEYRCRKVDHFN